MSGRLSPRSVELPSGVRIEYLEVGQGTPIVYLHGGGGVFRNAAFMPALASAYRVLAPSRARAMTARLGPAPRPARMPRSCWHSSAQWLTDRSM